MSEDKIVEALELFVSALENAVAVLKQNLPMKEQDNSKLRSWSPEKVKWVEAEGYRGPYERADPQSADDYKLLLSDLKAHDGKLTRDGWFYWTFRDQATIGRKRRRQPSSSDPHVRMEKNIENLKRAGETLTKEQA